MQCDAAVLATAVCLIVLLQLLGVVCYYAITDVPEVQWQSAVAAAEEVEVGTHALSGTRYPGSRQHQEIALALAFTP